ncbi:MAG: amidohydrolase family protein [Planctomycetota bacterium]
MAKNCYLFRDEHIPSKAAFPAIDAHNHLWGNWNTSRIAAVMDTVGLISYCDVTANVKINFAHGGYTTRQANIKDFFTNCDVPYPGRFYCFTMATFARDPTRPLFDDAAGFVEETIQTLHKHVRMGAKGLKILKELGLRHRDKTGNLITVDDPKLSPIWQEAGKLGIPVLIHQTDPYGFFEPVEPENEHYESLKKFSSWSFADSKFPRKLDLLARRDNLIRQHPATTFILPHVANFAENLNYVSSLLEENPNVYIDFSARMDELGRQPYTCREFFIRHQDRIIFGTDMPADTDNSIDMYRSYFRFLETYDESFYAPDYDGTFERARWPICGIGLPKDVLAKIYYKNILKIIPGLKKDFKKVLPEN